MKINHLKRRIVVIFVWAIVEYSMGISILANVLTGTPTSRFVGNLIVFGIGSAGLWVVMGIQRRSTRERGKQEKTWEGIKKEIETGGISVPEAGEPTAMQTGSFELEEQVLERGKVFFEGEADFRVAKIFSNVRITKSRPPEDKAPELST